MKDFLLQRRLERLEKHGNNDLLLIMEFGAKAYSNYELADVLEEVKCQKQEASRLQHSLFLVGFSISLWIAASFLAAAFEFQVMSVVFLALVPLSLLIALAGHFLLRKKFPAFREIHLVASIIQQELDRRKKDASIF